MASSAEIKIFERPSDLKTKSLRIRQPHRYPLCQDFRLEALLPDPTSSSYFRVLNHYSSLMLSKTDNSPQRLGRRPQPFSWPPLGIEELKGLSERDLYDRSGLPKVQYCEMLVDGLNSAVQSGEQINLLVASLDSSSIILGYALTMPASANSATDWISKAVIAPQFRRMGFGLLLEQSCVERFFRENPRRRNLAAGVNLPPLDFFDGVRTDTLIRRHDPLDFDYLALLNRVIRSRKSPRKAKKLADRILKTLLDPARLYLRTSQISERLRSSDLELPTPAALLCLFGWRYSQININDTYVFGSHNPVHSQRWVMYREFFPYVSRHLLTT